MQQNQPRHRAPHPPAARARAHADQDRKESNRAEADGELLQISSTRPRRAEARVVRLARVGDARGELAADVVRVGEAALVLRGVRRVGVDGDEDDLPLAALVEPVADADVPFDMVLVFGYDPGGCRDERPGWRKRGRESSPIGLTRGEGVLEGGV